MTSQAGAWIVALALIQGSAALGLGAEASSEVTWVDEAHSRVLFVPGTLLQSLQWEDATVPSLSEIGLSDFDREVLIAGYEWFKGPGKMALSDILAGKCSLVASAVNVKSESFQGSKPLAEWLRTKGGRAYVATVSSIEQGWTPPSHSVGTRFRLEAFVPILGDSPAAPNSGLARVEPVGWLVLGNTTLCSSRTTVLGNSSPGSKVFVWEGPGPPGNPGPPTFLILPVTTEGIDTRACSFCAAELPVTPDSLRQSLGGQ